jgi:2-phosphosulfolactate phosphatase
MFDVQYANLETCGRARGLAVVIDVVRAFTTAAHVLDRGAREIWPVAGVDEAFAIRERHPDVLLIGEWNGGIRVDGFDAGNSPSQLDGLDFAERVVVQRTSAGTQGIARSVNADRLLAASFVCAAATARAIRALADGSVTFVITGARADRDGDEDRACADYLVRLLAADSGDRARSRSEPFVDRVLRSGAARHFAASDHPDFPAADLDLATEVDRFDFAMHVTQEAGRAVLRAY